MGKGKGDPAGWVAPVTPGRILFEVEGVPFDVAKEALRLGAQKLPVLHMMHLHTRRNSW